MKKGLVESTNAVLHGDNFLVAAQYIRFLIKWKMKWTIQDQKPRIAFSATCDWPLESIHATSFMLLGKIDSYIAIIVSYNLASLPISNFLCRFSQKGGLWNKQGEL